MSKEYRKKVILGLIMEGLGQASTGLQTRWATRRLRNDPNGVYVSALAKGGLPAEISGSADFRGGSVAISGVRLRLKATPQILRAFRPARPPVRLGRITQDIPRDPEAPNYERISIDLDGTTDPIGRVVMRGRELLRLHTFVSENEGVWTYDCNRGHLGTEVIEHRSDAGYDRVVFLTDDLANSTIYGAQELVHPLLRSATLFQQDASGDYTTERTLRRYVLRDITQPTPKEVELTLDSALELVRARQLCGSLWTGRREQAIRDDDLAPTPVFTGDGVPSSGRLAASGSEALFSVGGDTLVRASWLSSQNGPASVVLPVGTARAIAGAPAWDPREQDSDQISEAFSNSPEAPNLNDSDDSRNARLATNVIDLVQQILTTTEAVTYGKPGLNGDYDLGIEQLGCAVPESHLDLDSFDAARLSIPGNPEQTKVHFATDGEPIDALPLIQRLLWPYGYLLVPGKEGALALKRISSSRTGDEPQITLSDFRGKPSQASRLYDPLDQANVLYDDRPGIGPRRQPFRDVARLDRQVASARESEMDLRGIADYDVAEAQTLAQIQRWRVEMSEWSLPLRTTDTTLRLREGDKVLVSHPQLTAPGGKRGVTEALCIVIDASWSLKLRRDSGPTVRVIWVGQRLERQGKRGPAAKVASRAISTVTLEPGTFSATLAPGQTDDTYGFAVDQQAQFVTEDHETVLDTEEITSISDLTITLGGTVSIGVGAGAVMVLAPYTTQPDEPKTEYAAWADGDPATVGPDDETAERAFQWTD